MFHRLRWRLLLSFALVIGVALGATGLFVSRAASSEIEGLQDRTEDQRSQLLITVLATHYDQRQGWRGVQNVLDRVGEIYNQRIVVVSGNGIVVADSRRSIVGRLMRQRGESEHRLPVIGPGGTAYTMLINPNPLPGESVAPAAESDLPSINRFLIWSGLLTAALAIILTFFLSRRSLAPVESLSRAARALARGDFSQRVEVKTRDEVGELARTFNTMAEELARTEEVRHGLVADVAHELRTPVSNIRGYLEAIKDGLLQADASTLDSMHEEAVLLARLIDDLQELALAESGQLALYTQPCDMADLVRKAIVAVGPQALAKAVQVEQQVPDSMPIEADPERISQVLRNLLVNSTNYTPPGGRIRVWAEVVADEARVNVEDTGAGIPPEELPYVFERFYRVDKSRSRATGGVGLGLTVARRLVEAHGGKIMALSQEGEGSTFTFTIPTRPATNQGG